MMWAWKLPAAFLTQTVKKKFGRLRFRLQT
jgi:hypothetical protein